MNQTIDTSLPPVFTIDGGAATGKGTVRQALANRLGFHSLDSGILYRAVGILSYRKHEIVVEHIVEIALSLKIESDKDRIILNGVDETEAVRSQHAGEEASKVAKIPEIRKALREFQLRERKFPGLVTDGRDQGFIFDNSYRYFFIIDPMIAAVRRSIQLRQMNQPADLDAILAEIIKRNTKDKERKVDPLIPHPEAEIIDTAGKSVEEIVEYMISHSKIKV